MNIELPWPDRALHPNSRPHWATKAKAAKKARRDAFLATLVAMSKGAPVFVDGKANVRLMFCPPSRRRFDLDGALSSCKAALDGIADALGIDDSNFTITLQKWPVKKGGAVYVEVYA